MSADGAIVFLNAQAESMFQYARDALVGEPIEALVPERAREIHPGSRAAYFAAPETRPMGLGLELTARRRDGSEFPVDISLSSIDAAEGPLVYAAVRDITERKERERDQKLLSAIVESSEDAIYSITLDGTVTSWNQAAVRLFGYEPDEIVGRPATILAAVDRRDEQRAILDQISIGERVEHFDTDQLTKAGGQIDVSLTVSPILGTEGRPVSASVIAHDIGERKRLERFKDEFIRNAAHELRTPLAALAGFGHLLAADWKTLGQEQVEQHLAAMDRQGQRAIALVANLLALSRRSDELVKHLDDVDVAAAVERCIEVASPPDGVTVSTDIEKGSTVVADSGELDQVLTNLLTNAYRYGGPNVSVSACSVGERTMLRVSDDGAGVPDALVARLFEPFSRGSTSRAFGGSGLGLAICRRIVEASGGSITYAAAQPRGATFDVLLRTRR